VYPSLDVEAHTTFEKERVLAGVAGVRFSAPTDSTRFDVTLAFAGDVQPSTEPGRAVKFDIQPTLSSDARIEAATEGPFTAGARELTDAELLSLITLGRLEVRPQLAGEGGLGTAVAGSAIDTAIDLLVVSELQNALSKALGLDVVEIRTTSLSSLLENSGEPFGVSLRLGGYLTPELFASYRIGTFDDSGLAGFSNEVSLRYDLGPLGVDLSGRLTFPDLPSVTGVTGPVPELGAGLSYAFTQKLGLDTGISLSNARQAVHFGVTLRW
jgi:hypothetical protein